MPEVAFIRQSALRGEGPRRTDVFYAIVDGVRVIKVVVETKTSRIVAVAFGDGPCDVLLAAVDNAQESVLRAIGDSSNWSEWAATLPYPVVSDENEKDKLFEGFGVPLDGRAVVHGSPDFVAILFPGAPAAAAPADPAPAAPAPAAAAVSPPTTAGMPPRGGHFQVRVLNSSLGPMMCDLDDTPVEDGTLVVDGIKFRVHGLDLDSTDRTVFVKPVCKRPAASAAGDAMACSPAAACDPDDSDEGQENKRRCPAPAAAANGSGTDGSGTDDEAAYPAAPAPAPTTTWREMSDELWAQSITFPESDDDSDGSGTDDEADVELPEGPIWGPPAPAAPAPAAPAAGDAMACSPATASEEPHVPLAYLSALFYDDAGVAQKYDVGSMTRADFDTYKCSVESDGEDYIKVAETSWIVQIERPCPFTGDVFVTLRLQ